MYSDKTLALPDSQVNTKVAELLKVLPSKGGSEADGLVTTWLKWLGDETPPLRDGQNFTFVYYDFKGTASKVELQASFMDGRAEALKQVPGTRFYYKGYKISKPEKLIYNFKVSTSQGESLVMDPFNPYAIPGTPPQSRILDLLMTTGQRLYFSADSDPALKGQDLVLYVPPYYERDLSRSYPVVYLLGVPEGPWDAPLEQEVQNKTMQEVLVVYPVNKASFDKTYLESAFLQVVKPWVERHFRTLSDKDNTLLIGWDAAAKGASDLQASHGELFGKVWTLSSRNEPQFSDQLWSSRGVAAIRTFFPPKEDEVQP